MRISLSGTYSTGKTTLADRAGAILRERFDGEFAYIREVARSVIARGLPLDRDATVESYLAYIEAQLEAERRADVPHVLSDRSLIDLLAYLRHPTSAHLPDTLEPMLAEIVRWESRRFDRYCHIPIEFPITHDGVRTPDERYRAEIDQLLVAALDEFGVRWETVGGTVEERTFRLMGLFGITP